MAFADDVKTNLEAARAATARGLRALADQVERLPLEDLGEALTWIEVHLDRLRREADRVLRGGGTPGARSSRQQ